MTLPSNWVAHCHCSMCRRAHSAPFVTWLSVPREQFRIVAGEADLAWFRSSPPAKRAFCQRCGSPLLFESERWPGEIHIARAAIPGDVDRAPQVHAFYSDRATWLELHDDLPKRGGVTGVEPLP
ncbi:MAG: GFA family protein [Kofleriaceae bacterium]